MSDNKIEFGLLDYGFREPSLNSLEIIKDVLNYAKLADRLGFNRFWLAEHHITDSTAAWYNPFPVLPLIAGITKKIKVGIAGTQLNMHNPYHIALNYKLLANLFPERIDLGLAGGNLPNKNISEYFGTVPIDFERKRLQVVELLLNEERLLLEKELIIPPFKGEIPDIWYLSSSYNKMAEITALNLNFSRSIFHGSDLAFYREELNIFRRTFYKVNRRYPRITLAFSGCCHNSDRKAKEIVESSDYKGVKRINVYGSINKFADIIYKYQEDYGINEFTFLNMAMKSKDRSLGINLICKAFNL